MQLRTPLSIGSRSVLMISIALFGSSCGGNPLFTRTTAQAVALKSIRYVRHYPVVADPGNGPDLAIEYLIAGDPYGRSEVPGGTLVPESDGSFADPHATDYRIPVDTVFSVWIYDPALGPSHGQVAQDIWVNGTHLTPTVLADGDERADATIGADGVVTPRSSHQ